MQRSSGTLAACWPHGDRLRQPFGTKRQPPAATPRLRGVACHRRERPGLASGRGRAVSRPHRRLPTTAVGAPARGRATPVGFPPLPRRSAALARMSVPTSCTWKRSFRGFPAIVVSGGSGQSPQNIAERCDPFADVGRCACGVTEDESRLAWALSVPGQGLYFHAARERRGS